MDEMNGMKCPSCGVDLELKAAMPAEDASMPEPTMEEANTLPLDTLRKRLPKKSEE